MYQVRLDQIIQKFAVLLEAAGYKAAEDLIRTELVPMAQRGHITLAQSANCYADQDEEQDTSYFQLFHALQAISANEMEDPDFHEPL